MFSSGDAEQAMKLYSKVIPNSEIKVIERYGPKIPGPEGKLYRGVMTIAGVEYRFFDSPVPHAFGFTPAISLFVTCKSASEVDSIFAGIGEGGTIMMPLGDYPFSKRFGWTSDRFGVSWQIFLAP